MNEKTYSFVENQLQIKPLCELVTELEAIVKKLTNPEETYDLLDSYNRGKNNEFEELQDKALTLIHEIKTTKQIVEPITDIFYLKKLKRFEPNSDLLASFYFEFHPNDLEFIRRMIAIWTGRQLDDWQFREMIEDLSCWFYMKAYPVFDHIWLSQAIIEEVKRGNYTSLSRPQKFDNRIPRDD